MSRSRIEIKIDRSRCVLCGELNDCALARDGADADEPCWCVDESFPVSLRARATDQDGGDSCICRACLAKDRREQG
jgi:hypothetical protein